MSRAPWHERFSAERAIAARVAAGRDRGVVTLQRSDHLELAAWDVAAGTVRPLGLRTDGFDDSWWPAPDGTALFRLADDSGEELGHVERVELADPAARRDLTPDEPRYAVRGGDTSRDGRTVAVVAVDGSGYRLLVGPADGGGAPRTLLRTPHEAFTTRLSADGRLVTVDTTDHRPGQRRFAVTVLDTADGTTVATYADPGGGSATAVRFAPGAGDARLLLAVRSEPDGWVRPVLWDPRTGAARVLAGAGDPADVVPLDWSDDGGAVLLGRQEMAVQTLHVLDLADGTVEQVPVPAGSAWLPMVRTSSFGPGRSVLAVTETAGTPLTVRSWTPGAEPEVVLAPPAVPDGRPARSVTFPSADGTLVQGWLVTPAGPGPHPAVVHAHGGPHWLVPDAYNPAAQAWADAGYAYLTVNYRGSTGRGTAFAEQVRGDVGRLELEDLAAAHAWLVRSGTARADQVLLTGESYGGFLTLYGLGRQPALWAGGIAEVAIGDWALAYRDASPALQGAMRTFLGGGPDERPDLYRDRSPLTHAAAVRAPVMVWQGRHDSRTPPAQLEAFAARLRELGREITVHWFDSGHGLPGGEEHREHQERCLAFAAAALGDRRRTA
ncbi:S9 family peptidase [Geodermatophilus sp. SYSU D00815]